MGQSPYGFRMVAQCFPQQKAGCFSNEGAPARRWIAQQLSAQIGAHLKLALRMKPIIEARAKAQQLRKPEDSVRLISDEQTPDIFTNEIQPAQAEPATPAIRTDTAVAALASLSKGVSTIGDTPQYARVRM